MSDGHSQRQGLPQHLAGQSNGVYDPRQQGGQQILTPSPNAAGSQSLQQVQDHRASMLEALQQGQRGPPRTGVSSNIMAGTSFQCGIKLGSDHRAFQGDDEKVYHI